MVATQDHVAATRRPGYQPLVVVLAAVCAGILLDRYLPARLIFWWLLAGGLWSVWLVAWLNCREARSNLSLLLCLAATGAAWHDACWSLFPVDDLGAFATEAAQPVCLEAVVRRGPRRIPAPQFDPLRPITASERTRLALRVTGLRHADRWEAASGSVTLDVDGHLLSVAAGDRLRIFGQIRAPRGPMNPGEFDFADHLRADRHLCRLATDHPACVTSIERGSWWQPVRWWDRLRRAGDNALWNSVDRAQSGLALALVLGEREELDAESTRQFYESGTVHLLSISGLHVGLLALVLFRGLELGFWRRRPALVAVAMITALYALVIDAEPPAVRATVMVWLVCAALYTGRPVSPFNLLAASALIVLALNPADLFRVGPQLSFLAVATLAWVGQRVARRSPRDPLERLIAGSRPWPDRVLRTFAQSTGRFLLLTAAVWLVSLPLVLARFHIVSPAALWLTPLLTLPIAVGLIAGFILVTFGWLIWPLSIPLAWVCDGSLAIVSRAIAACDHIPLSHLWLPGPSWWWLAGCYSLLALSTASARWRPPRRWCVAILAGWTAVGLLVGHTENTPRSTVDCTFLSVGHGCATLLELPDGTTLLYDAGQLGSPAAAARSVSDFLWSRGRTHIDAVVISHSDVDHYNALPELLRRFSVGIVYVSPVMFDGASAATETLRHAIEQAGVPMREIYAGDRLRSAPDCTIEVLHPPRRGTLGSDNSNSIVLDIQYRGRRLLLPGDLESPGLDELLAETPLDCDVVLAPHHGSMRSDPPGFAAWTTPEWVVISGDSRSTRPQVADAYRERGATVLNTSQTGAVTVTINPQGMQVSTHRAGVPSRPAQPSAELDVDDEQAANMD